MLLKLLERLDCQRFEPFVISLTPHSDLEANITRLGIPVSCLAMRGRPFDVRYFFELVFLLKRLQPDIVHTWMYHADLIGGVAARLAGIKTLGWCIRNGNLDVAKTKFMTRVIVKFCALISHWLPSSILSCSEEARLIHVANGYAANKIVVVPNGFDLTSFKPDEAARALVRNELGLNPDTPLVGLIGRYDPQKNHSGFLKAANKLLHQIPNAHFLLVGKGVDYLNSDLVQAAKLEGVFENSHFLGLRHDIPHLMASLDVFVSASSYGEAFPNVLGEAMSCGVPCAVTDTGDAAYIVADTGRVVAVGDMDGLANAIKQLLELSFKEKQILGERARSRVADHFEIGQIVRQYEGFYQQLLDMN